MKAKKISSFFGKIVAVSIVLFILAVAVMIEYKIASYYFSAQEVFSEGEIVRASSVKSEYVRIGYNFGYRHTVQFHTLEGEVIIVDLGMGNLYSEKNIPPYPEIVYNKLEPEIAFLNDKDKELSIKWFFVSSMAFLIFICLISLYLLSFKS